MTPSNRPHPNEENISPEPRGGNHRVARKSGASAKSRILEELKQVRAIWDEAETNRSRTPFLALLVLMLGLLIQQVGQLTTSWNQNNQLTYKISETVKSVKVARQEKIQLTRKLESLSLELLRLESTSPGAARLISDYGIEKR